MAASAGATEDLVVRSDMALGCARNKRRQVSFDTFFEKKRKRLCCKVDTHNPSHTLVLAPRPPFCPVPVGKVRDVKEREVMLLRWKCPSAELPARQNECDGYLIASVPRWFACGWVAIGLLCCWKPVL